VCCESGIAAYAVCDPKFGGPSFNDLFRQLKHSLDLNLTLIRATESGRDHDIGSQAVFLCTFRDRIPSHN